MNTVGFNQEIHLQNVISRYYMVESCNMSEAFEDFLVTILNLGYTMNSGFFYSINSDMSQETELLIQTFLPVVEENQNDLPDEYQYNSYFQVNNMMAVRVFGEEEEKFEAALQDLVTEMVVQKLELRTPPFYLVSQMNDKVYTDIMVGVRS